MHNAHCSAAPIVAVPPPATQTQRPLVTILHPHSVVQSLRAYRFRFCTTCSKLDLLMVCSSNASAFLQSSQRCLPLAFLNMSPSKYWLKKYLSFRSLHALHVRKPHFFLPCTQVLHEQVFSSSNHCSAPYAACPFLCPHWLHTFVFMAQSKHFRPRSCSFHALVENSSFAFRMAHSEHDFFS